MFYSVWNKPGYQTNFHHHDIDLGYISQNILCTSISRSVPFQGPGSDPPLVRESVKLRRRPAAGNFRIQGNPLVSLMT